ncbi:MAG: hypothetical protein LBB40_05755 [Holophagales bacterium]|nr:hypothetical protein [Holophagales bacterium]
MTRYLFSPFLALFVMPLVAQAMDESSPRFSFKYGTTPTIGTQGYQNDRVGLLFGGEFSYPVWKGELFLGAEYRVFRAMDYEVTRFGDEAGYSTADGTRGMITPYVRDPNSTPVPNMIWPDSRFDSADIRQSQLEGLTFKLAYRHSVGKIPYVGNTGLQCGLILNLLNSVQNATGSINVLVYRNVSQNAAPTALTAHSDLSAYGRLSNESFYLENQAKKLLPGLFVGTRSMLTDNFSFELNLSVLGHAEVNYVPSSYTGMSAHTETSNHYKTVLEFIAGFRF